MFTLHLEEEGWAQLRNQVGDISWVCSEVTLGKMEHIELWSGVVRLLRCWGSRRRGGTGLPVENDYPMWWWCPCSRLHLLKEAPAHLSPCLQSRSRGKWFLTQRLSSKTIPVRFCSRNGCPAPLAVTGTLLLSQQVPSTMGHFIWTELQYHESIFGSRFSLPVSLWGHIDPICLFSFQKMKICFLWLWLPALVRVKLSALFLLEPLWPPAGSSIPVSGTSHQGNTAGFADSRWVRPSGS